MPDGKTSYNSRSRKSFRPEGEPTTAEALAIELAAVERLRTEAEGIRLRLKDIRHEEYVRKARITRMRASIAAQAEADILAAYRAEQDEIVATSE